VDENPKTYRLEVEALELGFNTRAVGIDLVTSDTREPFVNPDAASIWAAIVPALAGEEPWVLDFFAHLGRIRDFCRDHGLSFREPNSHTLVLPSPEQAALSVLVERFSGERFGVRAGGAALNGKAESERQIADRLAAKGLDAYDTAYHESVFCAICDFETGALTILSDKLWASEVIRRIRPAVKDRDVEVTRPS
jgi:hypothetical protein